MEGGPRLRLSVVGRLGAHGDVREPLPGGQAERLLQLLLAAEGQFVPLDTIVAALWDDAPPDRADRNVAVLVSRLRRALGKDRVQRRTHGYRVVLDEQCTLDVSEGERLVRASEHALAEQMHALALTSAERAAGILGADLPLADAPDRDWVQALRQRVGTLLRRARLALAAAAEELGDDRTAVEAASRALAADPLDEEACRVLMRAHQRSGESGAALRVYEALRDTLAEQLGIDPSRATRQTYLAVLRGHHAGREPLRARPPSASASPDDLAGRDAELGALHARWAEAVAGHGGLTAVTGEAGVGKTALVAAFSADVQRAGGTTLSASCFEAERSVYLQPLVEALREAVGGCAPGTLHALCSGWAGTLSELVPDVAAVTAPGRYEPAAPELEHRRSLEALAVFLSRLGDLAPVLLVIEDVQYAGQSTVEALHFLATRLGHARVLVVLTERAEDGTPVTDALCDHARRVALGPLDRPTVEALIRRSGLRYDVDRFVEWTGGSPLFVVELLHHPDPDGQEAPGPPRIPESLHDAVAERFARVGAETHALLQCAAVLGSRFSLEDLAALTRHDPEECARRADRALHAGLLVTHGRTFRFANDIVHELAYASIPEPIRVSRHRRAAALFEHRPETSAAHSTAAGDWERAARSGLLAAEAAHLALANREAEALLTRALASAEHSGDGQLTMSVLTRRGQVRSDLGAHEQAREDHERALALARELDDEMLEARALEQLGWTALHARDAPGATDLAVRATHLAESVAASPSAVPSALLLVGRVRHWDGDYAGAAGAYAQVLDTGPDVRTTATALAYQGALLQHTDRFLEARRVLERAHTLAREAGEFRLLLQTLFFTALARGDSGDLHGALRALDRARRLLDEHGVHYYRAGIETTTSWLWREMGEPDVAREHALQAVDLAQRGGGTLELEQGLHAQLALAECDLALGRGDDAGARVEAAAAFLDTWLPYKPRGRMRLLEMRAREDPEVAEHLLDTARRYSSAKYEALALRHLGRVEEAARTASATGSDLLVARLGAPRARRAALDRISAALPPALAASFTARGPAAVALSETR